MIQTAGFSGDMDRFTLPALDSLGWLIDLGTKYAYIAHEICYHKSEYNNDNKGNIYLNKSKFDFQYITLEELIDYKNACINNYTKLKLKHLKDL